MNVVETGLAGCVLIEPRVFGDERGFFLETWSQRTFAGAGLDLAFVQDNHSRSARGVLRGLHYQSPNPQGKLVRVTAGAVWDVAVDLRRASPTFGQSVGYELSAGNKRMLYMPEGFGHGFLTLTDGTDFMYKCTAFYEPAAERCIRWDDSALAIPWPLASGETPTVSAKDAAGVTFAQAEMFA